MAAVTLILLTAGCGSGAAEGDTADAAGPPTTASETAQLLTFEAATVDGGRLAGSELVGRDVAIWFWAPW